MHVIRPVQPDNLESLYGISLATGHEGRDSAYLYIDPKIMGHIYVAPYAVPAPSMSLVAHDEVGVVGFVAGAIDTAQWQTRLEAEWWQHFLARYSDPHERSRQMWTPDQRRASMIQHPARTPTWVTEFYPAHLHLNLLVHAQGLGLGTLLFNAWLGLAVAHYVSGIHFGVNRSNDRAIAFWSKCGFARLASDNATESRTVWMGRKQVR